MLFKMLFSKFRRPKRRPFAPRPLGPLAPLRYLARRLCHGVFLLLGVSALSFVFFELAPGEFYDEMKLNPQVSPETVAALRRQYGMDRPLPARYLLWLQSVLKGELGFSFAGKKLVEVVRIYICSKRDSARMRLPAI